MSLLDKGRLPRPLVFGVLATFAILIGMACAALANVSTAVAYEVYLFTAQGTQECGAACSYSENHVYYLSTPIGYRDGDDGTVIRNANGEQIGYLMAPEPVVEAN